MIDNDVLTKALADHLPRQRWFSGDEGSIRGIDVTCSEVLREEWPALLHIIVDVHLGGADEPATYQVVLGLRPVDTREAFLEGKKDAIIGELATDRGDALAYDAVIDPELAVHLVRHVAPDEEVERARPLALEQSNTSVVFDERLILKLFRRLHDGPNPDAEVTRALVAAGFDHVADPVAEWRGERSDLAVVNEFLVGATEGLSLAITSLRDLYDRRSDPEEAGGDFGPEAQRLGEITARMHLALAEAFGDEPGGPRSWAADMEAHLARVRHPDVDHERIAALYGRLGSLSDAGRAIRIHGDYHLSQVMRTDAGWYVLDFEGEPDRPLEERRRPSSPMRDVAGMTRSFHYASQIALREWRADLDADLVEVAESWERHNSSAFIDGYLGTDGIDTLLPASEADRRLLLAAFELDKAVYEVGYEQGHRPEWVGIPLSAVQRILERA